MFGGHDFSAGVVGGAVAVAVVVAAAASPLRIF